MYNKNLAMAVKVNGEVLREIDGKVYLPFGSEYTLYFKNTSTRRVKIKVSVDGQDAMDGATLIVRENSTAELKRFMKNGNMNDGNSFKFIEKTHQISQHRGDRVEDGLITVQYEFEREEPIWYSRAFPLQATNRPHPDSYYSKGLNSGDFHADTITTYSSSVHDGAASMDWSSSLEDSAPRAALNMVAQNTAGITAPGSYNSQQFIKSSWAGTDASTKASMTIHLMGVIEEVDPVVEEIILKHWQKEYGHTDVKVLPKERRVKKVIVEDDQGVHITADNITITGAKVSVAVTTKSQVECSMCGSKYKSGTKYCSECGTSLRIY